MISYYGTHSFATSRVLESAEVVFASGQVIGSTDGFVAVSGSPEVLLPSSPSNGQGYTVKDAIGIAATSGITIDGNGRNIDGLSSIDISTDYGALNFIYVEALDQWSIF